MVNIITTASELGYINIPDNTLIDISEMKNYPDEKVVIFAVADAAKGVSGKRGPRKGSHHTAKDGE